MSKNKIVFGLTLMLTTASANADVWLNDLDCTKYAEKESCVDMRVALKELDLSKYTSLTFDNQLKKITYLLNRDKDEIAAKRFKNLFTLFEENLEGEKKKAIKENKDNIWNLIVNYSKSEDYTSDVKYKF